MSYKSNLQLNNTRLTSNNTDLQSLIDQANTLPDIVEQATPEITVSTGGLITATAGDKSATKQLSTQAAKTVTPTTTNQTAVTSGEYTTGAIIVKGDSNLVAGNIKQGVSIFGVNGTLQEGDGGFGEAVEWSENEDAILTGTISGTYSNNTVTHIGYAAFHNCKSLTTVNFPACTSIGSYAFHSCKSLTSVNFPVCVSINSNAFYWCRSLTSVSFPVCSYISDFAFEYCYSLASISFPACLGIGSYVFSYCYNLTSLYLTGSSLCTLSNSNAFRSTPIGGYSASAGRYGSIYVPQSLLASYKAATNWAYFSSRFVAYSPSIITFTIVGTSYQAEEGMTWSEWCDSGYNTANASINGNNYVQISAGNFIVVDPSTGSPVLASATIKAGCAYLD
jgi:hypothetical protein